MQSKRRHVFIFLITATLLVACNLGAMAPEPTSPADDIFILPTFTLTPELRTSPTPTATYIPTVAPTATVTLFYNPTVTPTEQWSSCPGVVVTFDDTKKGDIFHFLRCEDGLEYDLGPLAKGFYAVGPNNKFFVYVTLDGFVYANRIGSPYLTELYNLGREHEFTAFNRKIPPDFRITFTGEGPIYRLVLYERNFGQKRMYSLPVGITQ